MLNICKCDVDSSFLRLGVLLLLVSLNSSYGQMGPPDRGGEGGKVGPSQDYKEYDSKSQQWRITKNRHQMMVPLFASGKSRVMTSSSHERLFIQNKFGQASSFDVPEKFYSSKMTVMYLKTQDSGNRLMAGGNFGSEGTREFNFGKDAVLGANVMYAFKMEKYGMLNVGGIYSSRQSIGLGLPVIPMVTYNYLNTESGYGFNVGFPMMAFSYGKDLGIEIKSNVKLPGAYLVSLGYRYQKASDIVLFSEVHDHAITYHDTEKSLRHLYLQQKDLGVKWSVDWVKFLGTDLSLGRSFSSRLMGANSSGVFSKRSTVQDFGTSWFGNLKMTIGF